MPLTAKGRKIMSEMQEQYGERGEEVFYRAKNAGKITGVDDDAEEKKKEDDDDEKQEAPGVALEKAEADLEMLEREQEQQEEGRELHNAIADRKKMIRGLRDAVRSQARDALVRVGGEPKDKKDDKKADADLDLHALESKQDAEELKKRILDAVADAERRLDALMPAH